MNFATPPAAPIVTVTPNPSIDVSTGFDRVEPDRKLRCDEPQREPGGGGLNVARAITGPTLPANGLNGMIDGLKQIVPLPMIVVGSGSLPPGVDERFYANLAEVVDGGAQEDADVARAARTIVDDAKCHVLVVSLGAAGALVVTRDVTDRIVAPIVPVRSRIGAGDSTVAGIALALTRGEPMARATRLGVAAGAAAVMTPGTELCRRDDVERLFSGMT